MLEDVETELIFVDTGPNTDLSSVPAPDCTLVIFSVTDNSSLNLAEARLEANKDDRTLILVGNKVDLVRTRTVSIAGQSCLIIFKSYKTLKT